MPPGQFERLQTDQQFNFTAATELGPLFERYHVIPGATEINGVNEPQRYTMFVNDPATSNPDSITFDCEILIA